MAGWVSSSVLRTPQQTSGVKRKAEPRRTHAKEKISPELQNKHGLWVERFEPGCRDELAVHKKKVDEVYDWIKRHATHRGNNPSRGASILLLVGPTGSGKSITLKVLAKDNGIHLKEWSHPLTVNAADCAQDSWKYVGWNEASRESVLESFGEFLFEGSRYKSLFDEDSQRIVVLEDIPSIFLKRPEEFHDYLRKYKRFGRCPLVIILCETSSSSEFKLFPPDLKTELGIDSISFNPVAVSLLTKAVKGVLRQAYLESGGSLCHVADAEIDSVIRGSEGDLRAAINLLEIATMGSSKVVRKIGFKGNDKNEKYSNDTRIGCSKKDSSLYIFHALGKIFYSKREESTVVQLLPPHLNHLERPPLKEIPEDVFSRTCVSHDLFLRMLHNNASSFYGDVESAARCLEWLSVGDYLCSLWDPTGTMISLGMSSVLRGLMFHIERPKGKSQFRSFKKPSFDRKMIDARLDSVRTHLFNYGSSIDIQVRDIMPYSYIIRPKNLSQGQWDVINDCVLTRKTSFLLKHTETSFNEKYVPESHDDVDPIEKNFEELQECFVDLAPESELEIEEVDSDQ